MDTQSDYIPEELEGKMTKAEEKAFDKEMKSKPKYIKETTTKKESDPTLEYLMNKPRLTMKEKKLLHQKLTDALYEGK